MSDLSYPFSVTVDTEVKQNDDIYYLNVKNFQYFGLSEKAVQTDSTLQDSLQMDYKEKQNKENKAKQEPLMAPINSSTKKELSNILIEPIKFDNSGNKYIDIKDDNNNDDYNVKPNSVILLNYGAAQPAVYAYVVDEREDIIWWEIEGWEEFRVHVWGKSYDQVDKSFQEMAKTIKSEKNVETVYYLAVTPVEDEGLELQYALEQGNTWGENYWLYEVKER